MNSFEYNSDNGMDADYDNSIESDNNRIEADYGNIVENDDNMENDMENDIEKQLENLNKFDNEKQLDLLKKEIGHIMVHGMVPPEGWFDDRYNIIINYSKLEWIELAKRFHNRDEYIHNTAIYISKIVDELMEERCTKPTFNLRNYQLLIYNVHSIWHYYKNIYVGQETDNDVIDLIEGMKFL